MNHVPRLSEAVFVGMCHEVGTLTQVRIRREVVDTFEVVMSPMCVMRGFERMNSGSYREGFRLKTSDIDVMFCHPNHKVICDLSQSNSYRKSKHTVFLMESHDLQPGFSKLRMITTSSDEKVNESCMEINGEKYVSSSLFRTNMLTFFQNFNALTSLSIPHGPCATFARGEKEFDSAFCFQSHHWPNIALPWIQRCLLKHWPQFSILFTIVQDGFHVVPISSSPSTLDRESEWRISFSGAEQKLVYSMNHCQFLCYGLLKIFLKEVVNAKREDPCLCSYFMKTITFWVIQSDSQLQWVPCNFLKCFWRCFTMLLSWVYEGICPNFFIPENNMFRVKVVGHRQVALFDQLYDLYCKGIPCLLLSPTIAKYLIRSILDKSLPFRPGIVSNVALDVGLFWEIHVLGEVKVNNEKEFGMTLISIEKLINEPSISSFRTVGAQYFFSSLIRNCSWLLCQQFELFSNKKRKIQLDRSLKLMKLATKFGFVSDILFLALYYYKICRYELCIECLNKARKKFSLPYVMYRGQVIEEAYMGELAGKSPCVKMRKAVMFQVRLLSAYLYIEELESEQNANKENGSCVLHIPPLVMLNMLFVLNHHRLGDTVRSQRSLQDLHSLMLSDDDSQIPNTSKDISWQILGICQEMCGDYEGALDSFQSSLDEIPFHRIEKATHMRMQTINNRAFM